MAMPGTMPDRNSLPIDCSATMPQITKAIEGGISGPSTPALTAIAGREGLVVAGRGHRRDQDRPDRGCRGGRRSRDRREHQRRQHRHHGEPARAVTHQHGGDVDQPLRQPAGRHQFAGQHEQRDREQAERLRSRHQLLGQKGRFDVSDHEQQHHDRADGDGERDAERDEGRRTGP